MCGCVRRRLHETRSKKRIETGKKKELLFYLWFFPFLGWKGRQEECMGKECGYLNSEGETRRFL